MALAPSCTQFPFLFEACMLIMVSPRDALTVALLSFAPRSGRGVHTDDTLLPATVLLPALMISVLGNLTRTQCLVVDPGGLTTNEQAAERGHHRVYLTRYFVASSTLIRSPLSGRSLECLMSTFGSSVVITLSCSKFKSDQLTCYHRCRDGCRGF